MRGYFSISTPVLFISGRRGGSLKEELPISREQDGLLYRADYVDERRVPHRHEELEMNLVLSGSGAYLIGDRRRDLHANSQIWLFPEQNHVLIDKSRDFEMWVIYFRQALVDRVCTGNAAEVLHRRTLRSVLSRRLADHQTNRISQLFTEIERASGDVGLYNVGLAYSLLLSWHEFSQATVITGHDVHPAVERAAFLIRDGAALRGNEELAHASGLSSTRLSRLFRSQMGVSLVDYWNRQRLERFFRLYGEGKRLSVTRAALDAGFGSYPQFYRVFHSHFGCGPAQYRRSGSFAQDKDETRETA